MFEAFVRIAKRLRIEWLRAKHRRFMKIGERFSCGRGTFFYAQNAITIGDDVYVGRNCSLECDAEIGNCVLIANSVAFVGRHDHQIDAIGIPIRRAPSVRSGYKAAGAGRIVVGDDVWIGYGAIILSGVSIGNGAIVGAGSLVAHDVPEFSIVAGVPARPIKNRLTGVQREQHVQLCQESLGIFR